MKYCEKCETRHKHPVGRQCKRDRGADSDIKAPDTSTIGGVSQHAQFPAMSTNPGIAATGVHGSSTAQTQAAPIGSQSGNQFTGTYVQSPMQQQSQQWQQWNYSPPWQQNMAWPSQGQWNNHTHHNQMPAYSPNASGAITHQVDNIMSSLDSIQKAINSFDSRLTAMETQSSAATVSPAMTGVQVPTHSAANIASGQVRQQLDTIGLSSSDSADSDKVKHFRTHRKYKKSKSGRCKTTEDFVMQQVSWPHHGIYQGQDRKPATYDTLSVTEFVQGYVSNVLNETSPGTAHSMLIHLQEMMQDASDFPWENVRNYHGIVLGQMEQDQLSWKDSSSIQELRTQYARAKAPPPAVTDALLCQDFQTYDSHTNPKNGQGGL